MKTGSSLFTKIIGWFFLNLILVVVGLALFFAFQPQMDLHAFFGQQVSSRLRTAGMLISHDLSQTTQTNWSSVLARHADIYQVNFALVLEDGSSFSSKDQEIPQAIKAEAQKALRRKRPNDFGAPPPPPEAYTRRPHVMTRTTHPTLYWNGIQIPLFSEQPLPPESALLLAVSNSVTGNGFFFDPLPWMFVVGFVILISALLWIPMVRNITRPLIRMTLATEKIAQGQFNVAIHEPRTDEIGRLARAINNMTSRLSALVHGQKRFLSDVAHELGSPIARIQFGLGALEQRVPEENRKRVNEVLEDVDHMSKLVNELLVFSRADMNSKTDKLARIALLPVIEMAVKREKTTAVEIITHIDSKIRVIASSELLTRALANLIRNAIKYAGDTGPIYVIAERKKDTVTIEVRDSGAGVAENLFDQLFEPFFRPEASRDRDSGGVGLGLAIVKTCVERCNGVVSARNLEPHGFAVTLTLKV